MTPDESNRAIVEAYVDAYNEHDRDRLETVLAPRIDVTGGEASRDEFLAGVDAWWDVSRHHADAGGDRR